MKGNGWNMRGNMERGGMEDEEEHRRMKDCRERTKNEREHRRLKVGRERKE